MRTGWFLLVLFAVGLVPAAAEPTQPPLVISHVNVVDVIHGGVQRDMTIVIVDGAIREVRHGQPSAEFPRGSIVIDGSGKFAIPGLWDMHQHFEGQPGTREFNLFLANGVLGIRNMGGVAGDVLRAREEIAQGKILGPRIVACGPIVDGPDPTNPSISVSVESPGDARRAVQSLKAMGADCVKVHDGVPLEAYIAMGDEARKMGLPLVGHVPVSVHTWQATNTGQRSIEHQIGLRGASTVEEQMLKSEKTDDTFARALRTKNYQLIPESIARKGNYILDHFSDQRASDLYRTYARNGTYLDPTLVTDRALTFVDEISRTDDPRLKYIPASQREWWKPERGMLTRHRTPAYIAFRKRQYEKTLSQIPVAHRAGVMFLAGTDTTLPFVYPGFSVHDEIALFVEAGLTPLEALQTATINPARFLGWEQSMGTVQPGRLASLVILEANPLEDIRNTTRISTVIVRGKPLGRSDLDGMLRSAEAAAREPLH